MDLSWEYRALAGASGSDIVEAVVPMTVVDHGPSPATFTALTCTSYCVPPLRPARSFSRVPEPDQASCSTVPVSVGLVGGVAANVAHVVGGNGRSASLTGGAPRHGKTCSLSSYRQYRGHAWHISRCSCAAGDIRSGACASGIYGRDPVVPCVPRRQPQVGVADAG